MNHKISREDSIEQPYSWIIAFASLSTLALAMGGNYLAIVSIPFLEIDMGWSRAAATSVYTATTLGAGIGGIVMGYFVSKKGVQPALFIAAAAIAGGCAIASLAENLPSLLLPVFLFIGMLGMGCGFAPLIANVTLWFDRNRGLAIAVVACGQTVAGSFWNITFEPLVSEYGWRSVYVGYGLFAAAAIIPLSFVHRRPAPELQQITGSKAGNTRRSIPDINPALLTFLLGMAIIGCCVAMSMPMAQMVAYCATLGFGTHIGAEIASFLLVCSGVSRLGFGLISERIGGLNTFLIGAGLQAAALSLFIFFDTQQQLYIISIMFGLVFGGIVPAYGLAVRELFPAQQAQTRTGIVYFFGYVGMGGGGLIGGFVYDVTLSYPTAFGVGVAFNLANIGLILLIKGLARSRTPQASEVVSA
jgi:MFS family permease